MGQQTLVWIIRNLYKVDTHTDAPLIRPPLPMVLYTSTSHDSFHPLPPHPILCPILKKNALPPNALLAWYHLEDLDLGDELEETMVWKKRDGDEKD